MTPDNENFLLSVAIDNIAEDSDAILEHSGLSDSDGADKAASDEADDMNVDDLFGFLDMDSDGDEYGISSLRRPPILTSPPSPCPARSRYFWKCKSAKNNHQIVYNKIPYNIPG